MAAPPRRFEVASPSTRNRKSQPDLSSRVCADGPKNPAGTRLRLCGLSVIRTVMASTSILSQPERKHPRWCLLRAEPAAASTASLGRLWERWSALIEQFDLEIFPVLLERLPRRIIVSAFQAVDEPLVFFRHFFGSGVEILPLCEEKLDLALEV